MNYVATLREKVGNDPLILVGSVVLVIKDGRVLLEQRTEPFGRYGLPGGLMEWAESPEGTARRELLEETGLEAGELELLGAYSGPGYVTTLRNGDVFQSVTLAYVASHATGTLQASDESLRLDYFPLDALPPDMIGSHERFIEDYKKALAE